MQNIRAGMRLRYDGYESTVVKVLGEDWFCVTMPEEEHEPVLLSLHERYEFCFLIDNETVHCAMGEIRARYREDNAAVMEIELISGLYRRDAQRFRGMDETEHQTVRRVCALAQAELPEEYMPQEQE